MQAPAIRSADVDREIEYANPGGYIGRCRMRAWLTERVVVVSELGTNRGMSVTNAIETIAVVVERSLGEQLGEEPGSFVLVEHYDAHSYNPPRIHDDKLPTLDVVRFAGRRGDRFYGPTWAPLHRRAPELSWLSEALS